MANVQRSNGYRPVNVTGQGPYTGRVAKYVATDTAALYVGDIVKFDGTTGVGAELGYRGVTAITATTDVPAGVVVGFAPLLTNLNLPQSYKEATGTDRVVYIADDPNAVFEANCVATIAGADVGLNISTGVTAGSTTTGTSAMELDGATEATTNTLIFRIVGFKDSPDNDPASVNQRTLVRFNRHAYANQIAGV